MKGRMVCGSKNKSPKLTLKSRFKASIARFRDESSISGIFEKAGSNKDRSVRYSTKTPLNLELSSVYDCQDYNTLMKVHLAMPRHLWHTLDGL